MKIIGAGMAGCLAGVFNPGARIYEAASGLPDNHKAVLRFRDDKISKATGIPFKKVNVRKSIWVNGTECTITPRYANWYSKKVAGKYISRSINNLDPVERYIAPGNFHQLLAELCEGRIFYDFKLSYIQPRQIVFGYEGEQEARYVKRPAGEPLISTIPMNIMAKIVEQELPVRFEHKPITVLRLKVSNAEVYQTIYYPELNTPVYRATMTGDDLIMELVRDGLKPYPYNQKETMDMVLGSFGFNSADVEGYELKEYEQRYGKIAPIDDAVRKSFMFKLTTERGVYSLGRYACWRNILLDDVYDDIYKIKRMMDHHHYDLNLEL